STTPVRIYGAPNAPDTLTVDSTRGLIAGPPGPAFDRGAGVGNTLGIPGTAAADSLHLTPTTPNPDHTPTISFHNAPTRRAFGGPVDKAYLYDSGGADSFVGTPTYSYLQTSQVVNIVSDFPEVRAFASTANDTATLVGSSGADNFVGTPKYSHLSGSGFTNIASGFAQVQANSGGGGSGTAALFDSAGDDLFL